MKSRSLKILCLLPVFLTGSCHAQEIAPVSQDVLDSSFIVSKTALDNAYLLLARKNKQYYAGFTIDSGGLNTPVLVEIDEVGGKQKKWAFEDIIADIFIFNSHMAIALNSGETFSLLDGAWKPNELTLPKKSRIVFSDGKQHLIACSPASPFKEGSRDSGCESYNPHWRVSFLWYDVRPKVCGDLLYAVTWSRTQNQRIAVNLDSGNIIHQEVFSGEDICAQFSK